MMHKRVVLTFPTNQVSQPIAYHLIKDFDLMLNILRGNITPNEEGRLVVELSGKKQSLEGGLDYLKTLGIGVESLARDIKWHKDICTHCTACVPACPTQALAVDRQAMIVSFVKDRCIACELCVPACPFKALEIQV
jgi:L-aspartate semialdehyde sulfurtransferase ferredoxin